MWRFWWWRNIFLIISWFLFRMKRKEIFSQHDGMIPIWIDDGTKNKWSTKVNFMDFSFTYKKVQRIKMTKNSITFSKNIYISGIQNSATSWNNNGNFYEMKILEWFFLQFWQNGPFFIIDKLYSHHALNFFTLWCFFSNLRTFYY